MIEFEVKGDLAKIQSSTIDANFAELNEWLKSEMSVYRNLVVLPENISEAKADRAKVRKIAARIDEQRKMVKKAYMIPYNAFEAKCKESLGFCNETVDHIDSQIKEYEAVQKGEKEAQIKQFYDSADYDEDVKRCATWKWLYNPRWLNATYDIEKAKSEVDEALKKAAEDLTVLKKQPEKYVPMLLDHYSENHSLAAAIGKCAEWQEREEALRRAAESAKKTPKTVENTAHAVKEASEDLKEFSEALDMIEISFKVKCSREQLIRLRNFLRAAGISYEPVN